MVFVLAFVSFTKNDSQNAEERRQKKKKRRRRRRDRRRGNKSRSARFSPSSFLSRILSLSLSGSSFPRSCEDVCGIRKRGQNKTKNGIGRNRAVLRAIVEMLAFVLLLLEEDFRGEAKHKTEKEVNAKRTTFCQISSKNIIHKPSSSC